MSIPQFLEVNLNILGIGKKQVVVEKGCSFENNGKIYRVNNDCKLSVFDKANKTWTAGDEITMTGYQFDTFQAVADNYKNEKYENGKQINKIVLSKSDINKAKDMYFSKDLSLTEDLNKNLKNNYSISNDNVKYYSNNNGFSAYVTNGISTQSANLIFKYGEAKDAVTLSELINKNNVQNNKNTPKAEQKQQSKPETKHEIKPKTPVNTITVTPKKQPLKNKKTSNKHYYNRAQNAKLPELFQNKLNQVIKKMGINESAFNKKVRQAAKDTGYSEYFIKYVISVENYEPKVRNTNDGTITGGFGHSKLRDKSLKIGQKVTPDKAFSWLKSDIKFFENKLKELKVDSNSKETIGDYWKTLPLSLKEAMIDVAFNRDHRKLQEAEEYQSLRANIKGGEEYLPASAVRLRQDFSKYSYKQKLGHKFTAGLMHRNCYRFLLSIRDLDDEYRRIAKQRFENAGNYYSETLKLLRAKGHNKEAQQLEKAWNSM